MAGLWSKRFNIVKMYNLLKLAYKLNIICKNINKLL